MTTSSRCINALSITSLYLIRPSSSAFQPQEIFKFSKMMLKLHRRLGSGLGLPFGTMTPLHRILVDWDWEADGIWWIRSAREQNEQKLPPWSYLLSAELVSALKKWNDDGGDLYGPKVIDSAQTDQRQTVFRNAGALLAEWVQRELGEEWEVLYNAGSEGWAWTWVQPPWRRN